MTEIRWATPIATATAIAQSEWKRELDEASTVFKTWKKNYPQEAEMNWWFYSGRLVIRPRVAKHLWENRHNNQMDLIPYDQNKRIMEALGVNLPSEVTPNASTGPQRSNPTRSRGHGGHLGAMAAILAAIM